MFHQDWTVGELVHSNAERNTKNSQRKHPQNSQGNNAEDSQGTNAERSSASVDAVGGGDDDLCSSDVQRSSVGVSGETDYCNETVYRIVASKTLVSVDWSDGTRTENIPSLDLIPKVGRTHVIDLVGPI